MRNAVFDRSIFHGEKFEKLKRSKLLERIRGQDVRLIYTPQFIEETLHFGYGRMKELLQQFQFLTEANSTHWFRMADQIVDAELGLRQVHHIYYLLKDEEIQRIIAGAKSFAEGVFNEDQLKDALERAHKEQMKNVQFRSHRLQMREQMPRQQYDFEREFERNAERLITDGVMANSPNSESYLTRWRNDRASCPFTEQYLRAWFAILYLPVVNHNLDISPNDRSDASQVAYMLWGDILVSDDIRFMKSCFELLFGETDKKCLTLEEFLGSIV